ncbi:(d)CMP kinase [Mariniblastus fucicola]|uniref:Cytidylate kinase n=1 Tax=Mariniblastus fucicola TaxID=980251 RepID=A0A5B9PE58_9BACT|nr:(d)CMP kinase [Mariniblastus fucicola]QEG21311.1 Cytidylate kinase [Mariniblastus fucicola]
MVIAIDGPAGAGKSTVTRKLADRLGFSFLDTGAMYRAVTWAAISRDVAFTDDDALLQLANSIQIAFDGDRVFVDEEDVSEPIRTPEVTRNIFHVADHPGIRGRLVELQRQIAATGNFVCEGRDQGTVAFPDSFCKIYLNASPQYRAMRRVAQLEAAGQYVDYDEVVAAQNLRDERDSNREVGRLMRAEDAIEVNTDNQSIANVVDELERIARAKIAARREG